MGITLSGHKSCCQTFRRAERRRPAFLLAATEATHDSWKDRHEQSERDILFASRLLSARNSERRSDTRGLDMLRPGPLILR